MKGTSFQAMTQISGRLIASFATLAVLALPGRAGAAVTSCSSLSVTNLPFGNYDAIARSAVQGTGTITLTCTANAAGAQTIEVRITATSSTACGAKFMASGSNNLSYSTYASADYSNEFCSGNIYTMNFAAANTPTTTSFTYYGQIAAGQNRPPGIYTDPFTATTAASGANATTTFRARATIPVACSISVAALAFGAYTGAVVSSSSGLDVTCTSTTNYTIQLGAGNNADGVSRRMLGAAGQYLRYGLYSDSVASAPWGNGTTLGAATSGTGTGSPQAYSVYGQVFASQAPTPGSYSDSVIATVVY